MHHMLRGSQLSAWRKGKRRRRGERGKEKKKIIKKKKLKKIFIIMKEAERISQWKTHQPEIPARPELSPLSFCYPWLPAAPFHLLFKAGEM